MPSIRYFNQTAPFWDFIAELESTGGEHPFFEAHNSESRQGPGDSKENPQDSSAPPDAGQQDAPTDPQASEHPHPHNPHHPHHGHPFGPGFPHGGHRGWQPRGGPNKFRRGGRCGGWEGSTQSFSKSFAGLPGRDFDVNKIGEFFASYFGPDNATNTADKSSSSNGNNSKDFTPSADVFDTEDAYIVHISLPGAKKEDVGVNWDADRSELSVAGVIYRPGDEDFLKTLALDERTVGVFEKKVRLGSRGSPAQVDIDAISAKMEDGVLVVQIPKLDREYVDVKKVDIE